MSNVIRKIHLVKSDPEKNNNKFWKATEYDDCSVFVQWGRVGDNGQSQTKNFSSQDQATKFIEKKVKSKKRAGRNGEIAYREVEIIDDEVSSSQVKTSTVSRDRLNQIASEQIQTKSKEVRELIPRLVKENAHQITQATGGQIQYNFEEGMFSTPLGLVTQTTIDNARDTLDNIGNLVNDGNYGNDLLEETRNYLMLVPQDIGRRKLDINQFWNDLNAVHKQNAILDGLQASLVKARKVSDKRDKEDGVAETVFDVSLDIVKDQKVINELTKMYRNTKQRMHSCQHLDVKRVFSVHIKSERESFEKDGKNLINIWPLWHGTRVSNLLSILKQGMVIPPNTSSHVTGRMFGNGVYASDQSTKALNYAYGYWGGGTDNNCFMFLVDMAMGKYYVPTGPFSGNHPPRGYDSTFAKGRKSGVMNNEMIVYRTSQVRLNYLFEFSPYGR